MTWKMLQESAGAVGGVIGLLTGLLTLFPTGRVWLGKAFHFIVAPLTAPWGMRRLEKRLIAVEHETQHNSGGSMKDVVRDTSDAVKKMVSQFESFMARMEARFRHDFQTKRSPAFEIDHHGRATLVSFALGQLCHVEDASLELASLAYLQFLDAAERDEFLRTYRESSADGSMFRMQIRWYSRMHENRGLWDVRATPLDDELYSAVLLPVDDIAREIACRNGWQN